MQALTAGTIIAGSYRVERLLGSGGMADVYLVTHTRLPRQFALKALRSTGAVVDMQDRFRREAEILASLHHPNLVDVVDWNIREDGQAYLIMELLEGEELANFLYRTGPLRPPVALQICAQIGDALLLAHRFGIVHRDLKPANIFLCRNGPVPNFVKVLDFGIAKLTQASTDARTDSALIMGTPGYMAPEQVIGANEHLDHRCDQFALAAILYEMLAGHAPFHRPGELPETILKRVMYATPEPLPLAHINEELSRALSKDPNARFPDTRMFLAAIGAISHTIYVPAAANVSPSASSLRPGEVIRKPSRRRSGAGVVLPLVVLCGVGAAGLLGLLAQRSQVRAPPPVLSAAALPAPAPVAVSPPVQPAVTALGAAPLPEISPPPAAEVVPHIRQGIRP